MAFRVILRFGCRAVDDAYQPSVDGVCPGIHIHRASTHAAGIHANIEQQMIRQTLEFAQMICIERDRLLSCRKPRANMVKKGGRGMNRHFKYLRFYQVQLDDELMNSLFSH